MSWRSIVLALTLSACAAQAQDKPLDDASPEANAAEREAKSSWPVPEAWQASQIDWEASLRRQRVDPRALPVDAQSALPRIKVPVLLPSDSERLKTLMLLGDETWYAATTSQGGLDVYIRGSQMSRPMEWSEADKQQMASPEEPWITRTHGIVAIMFSAHGVAYNLELECMVGDPRCEGDELAWAVYESLAVAEGAP